MLKEALRYLGVQGEADAETLRLILECMETVRDVAAPKIVMRRFTPTEFTPYRIGKDIQNHLEGATEIMVMAATLGISVDMEIKKEQTVDMARAAGLNACAAALIEAFCNENMPEGLTETSRFSPGYGDYPLSVQPKLLQAVRAEKIGITALESYMLLPTKSVTAIVPLGKSTKCKQSKCTHCEKTDCIYRRN
ncbi:MAG: Vitamin B12 dependent methionine synthase activation subunit [Ruminococcaceae bacterium]|nr:Vitamin B12 dependent methionine synthase activation subunit [Oscillospiraceae bacterium]